MTAEKELVESTKSSVISVGVWSVVAIILSVVIDNQDAIAGWLLTISPDWLDGIVSQAWALVIAVIMLFVGPSKRAKNSAYSK